MWVRKLFSFGLAAGVCLAVSGGCWWGEAKTPAERDYAKAKKSYNKQDYRTAVTDLSAYLNSYPDSSFASIAQFFLAESYRQLDLPSNALDTYDKFLAKNPNSPMAPMFIYYKARSLETTGKSADASTAYSQLVTSFNNAGPEQAKWVQLAQQRLNRLGPPARPVAPAK